MSRQCAYVPPSRSRQIWLSGVSIGRCSARKSPQRRASGASSSAHGLEQELGIGFASVHPAPAQHTAVMAAADCPNSSEHEACAAARSGAQASSRHQSEAKIIIFQTR